ncbi:unnamed protein product [Peronospora belbahrii]|uniref:Programmed cell death protein 2 C-terminal domain-containing protein n=1 Tax=Peronospora belbahrii TaxID=622444 RepID=A0AAU9LRW7_9STRA|nr:unnamed protein product [Peronospora belbahrii]CAH0520940.1 unnamed protein product [Peronospora belbahrii]
MDEDRVVLLGVIQERQSVDNNSPYVSKAGGTPAWYLKPPSEAASLTCSNCSKSLFLVAQVYAPVETDRTLYVFGCNSVSCMETLGSWRVLRDQVEVAKNDAALEEVEKLTEQVKLAWELDSDGSNWSDDDSNTQAPTVDLLDFEVLLQQRNDAMQIRTKTTKLTTPTNNTDHVKESASSIDRNAFSALLIEVIDEPCEDSTGDRDFEHENRLLEEYLKQEEEEKSTEIRELRNVITNLKKKQDAVHHASAATSTGESYEKTPAGQRHLLRFQKRISRCPQQCLRYDYGGEPLWPVVAPQDLKVPSCAGCGSDRLFEMQLYPTINYFLKVDEYVVIDTTLVDSSVSTSTTITSATSKTMVSTGGMDWLSLLIYSCSRSCGLSHEEFIYVVPSVTS